MDVFSNLSQYRDVMPEVVRKKVFGQCKNKKRVGTALFGYFFLLLRKSNTPSGRKTNDECYKKCLKRKLIYKENRPCIFCISAQSMEMSESNTPSGRNSNDESYKNASSESLQSNQTG
jgi:hypothetical protein